LKYKSWISNVSGHVFFHLSEPWNYRIDRIVGDIVHFNEKIGNERYISISLLSDLRDFRVKNKNRYTRIIFIADTYYKEPEDGKRLKGHIIFIQNKYNSLFDKKEEKCVKNLYKLQCKLAKLSKDEIEEQQDDLKEEFDINRQYILEYKDKYSYDYKIDFDIKSNGIITLDENISTTNKVIKDTILQAYYFIKFIFHNHTHHGKSSEDVVRLTNMSVSNKKFSSLMISDIKKYMVERKNKRDSLGELQGFSAYTKTLLYILNKEKYISQKKLKREENYFDNLIDSTEVYIKKNNIPIIHTKLKDIIEYVLKIFIILMSLIAPYSILKTRHMAEDNINNFISNQSIPLYVNGFLILVIGIFAIDFLYNRDRSFIHQKYNSFIYFTQSVIKKNYNPILSTNLFIDIFYSFIGIFIDFIQLVDNSSFSRKKMFYYIKPIIISTIIYFFYNYFKS